MRVRLTRRHCVYTRALAMVLAGLHLATISIAWGPGLSPLAAAPTANAGGPYSGDEGAPVAFTGDAIDAEDPTSALTFEWDFEFDGSFNVSMSGVSSTAPSHVYTDNGTFTVALRVRDTDSEVSAISTAAVTVANVPPSANAGGPYTTDEGSALGFTGSATDPGEDTLTYEWDFDYDGTTFTVDSSGVDLTSPSTTYADDGERSVALRVRDDDGGVSAVQTVVVTVNNVPPTANAGASYSGDEGSQITFSGSATDPGSDTLTYEWDFTYHGGVIKVDQSGDGLTAPSHTYLNDGEFTVALRVRDDDSVSATVTAPVTVSNVAPTPNAGGPYAGTVGTPVTFGGSAIDPGNDALRYEWDFEYDGVTFNTVGATTASGVDLVSPQYTYAQAGTFTVGLRVSDDDVASALVTAQVTVSSQVQPTSTPTPTATPTAVPPPPPPSGGGGGGGGGGGPQPTATPTPMATPTPTPTATSTATPSPTPTPTATPTATPSPAPTMTPVPTLTPEAVTTPSSDVAGWGEATEVEVRLEVRVSEEAAATDDEGNLIEVVPGAEITRRIGVDGAPDSIVIPVRLGEGDVLGSFEDPVSGATVVENILTIPLEDVTTGEITAFLEVRLRGVVGTDGGTAVAPIEEIRLVTAERQADFTADDPDVGQVAASIDVDLLRIPESASVQVRIEREPGREVSASFALTAADAGIEINDIAFAIDVRPENLSNETDLGEARINMTVSAAWVEAHGGAENVRIMRFSDGSSQILQTDLIGQLDGAYIFRGISPHGLSVLALVVLNVVPSTAPAVNATPSPASTPTASPTYTPAPSPTSTPTPSPSPTSTPPSTSTPSPTFTPTPPRLRSHLPPPAYVHTYPPPAYVHTYPPTYVHTYPPPPTSTPTPPPTSTPTPPPTSTPTPPPTSTPTSTSTPSPTSTPTLSPTSMPSAILSRTSTAAPAALHTAALDPPATPTPAGTPEKEASVTGFTVGAIMAIVVAVLAATGGVGGYLLRSRRIRRS